MIRVTCHTADNARSLEFDATPWFAEANPQNIIDLAHRGWSSEGIAEALEGRGGYERLHDLIRYAAARLEPESLEDPSWHTFECMIDWPGAVGWLETNRPEVAAMIPTQNRELR